MKYLIFALITLFCSCSSSKKVLIERTDEIKIPIDSKTEDRFIALNFLDTEDNDKIACLSLDEYHLLIIDLDKKKVEKKIDFDNKKSGLLFAGNDSIMTLEMMKNTLLRFNPITNSYDTNKINNLTYNSYQAYLSCTSMPIIKYNDCFYIQTQVNIPNPQKYHNSPIMIKYCPNINKFKFGMAWPANYQTGADYYEFDPAVCINNKGELYVSFPSNDTIFVYDSELKLLNRVDGSSKYSNGVFKPYLGANKKSSTHSQDSLMRYFVSKPGYIRMQYDKYRDLYYRVFMHANSAMNEDGSPYDYFNKKFSLLIFDSNLNLLKEEVMTGLDVNFLQFIVNSKGILFQSNNPNSKEYDNNYIKFIQYKVEVK